LPKYSGVGEGQRPSPFRTGPLTKDNTS